MVENSDAAPSYTQLFRNGAIEAVWIRPLLIYREEKKIPSLLFERVILNNVRLYLNFQESYLHVEPPLAVMLSLVGVAGYVMAVDASRHPYREVIPSTPIDRDTLLVPEIIVEKFDVDVNRAMKAIFDFVWNAAGLPSSIFYDNQGNRNLNG